MDTGIAHSTPLTGPSPTLAGRQHGVVARRQLLDAGVERARRSKVGFETAVSTRLHRGVYLVGHTVPTSPRRATWPRCSPAALTRSSATEAPRRSGSCFPTQPQPRLASPFRSGGAPPGPGIEVPSRRRSDERDVRWRERMPLTSPPRTILDLAGELGSEDLERLVAEANYRRLASARELRRPARAQPRQARQRHAAHRPRPSRRPGSHPLAGRAADASPASRGRVHRLRVEPANPRLRGGRAVAGAQLRGRDRRLRRPLRPARLRAGSAEGRNPEGSGSGRDADHAPPASRRPGRRGCEAPSGSRAAGYRPGERQDRSMPDSVASPWRAGAADCAAC